jgi:hypothetical protein
LPLPVLQKYQLLLWAAVEEEGVADVQGVAVEVWVTKITLQYPPEVHIPLLLEEAEHNQEMTQLIHIFVQLVL